VFSLPYVLHFFPNEFTGLRGWRKSFAFVLAGAFNCIFFWHNNIVSPPRPRLDADAANQVPERQVLLATKRTTLKTPDACYIAQVESTASILLRKRKLSDTSLIVSWCTESFGCVQTVVKGARRPKSPFAGKLDLFFEAEISIVRSRKSDLHTLTEVVLKNPFAGIRSNYLRTQTAAYFVELIEICTERDHREPELFGLLRRAFGYLDANDPTPRAVAHFETELARIAGVHDQTRLRSDPAYALGNLFGRLPLSRTPLLKTLAAKMKE
jgi:DNA repair protein RecO (recombination protein O)